MRFSCVTYLLDDTSSSALCGLELKFCCNFVVMPIADLFTTDCAESLYYRYNSFLKIKAQNLECIKYEILIGKETQRK